MSQQNARLPETEQKRKRNVAVYNPRDLNDAYQLKCLMRELTLVIHKQYSIAMSELGMRRFCRHNF